MKKQNGITLIALIITIIVMLILVGVTVNVALNGGLFDTAKQATERTETAMIQEELSVIEATMNANILANPERYTNTNDDAGTISMATTILQELQKYFVVENYVTEDGSALDIAKIEESGLAVLYPNEMKMRITLPCKYKDYEGNVIITVSLIGENIKIESFELKFNFPIYFDFDKSLLAAEDLAVYEALSEKDKQVYEGIWRGAYVFTDDAEYASKLASNDFSYTLETSTFILDGFMCASLNSLNLVPVGVNPDGSIFQLGDNPNIYYLMDSQYNMYEANQEKGQIRDAYGNIIAAEDIKNFTELPIVEYNGYTYTPRFDNKSVYIRSVPEQEVVDMKTDFEGISVRVIDQGAFKNSSTKRVILPDELLHLGSHVFGHCTNLEEVIMSDNITTINEYAFSNCDGVTLKFKDVNDIPEGQPWGGSNLTIESK